MKNQECSICCKEVEGLYVTTGSGSVAHRHCYTQKTPLNLADSIYQVARGNGDPILAAEVIAEMVPADLSNKIVNEFNRRLKQRWEQLCKPL